MARIKRITPLRMKKFLAALRETGRVTAAARAGEVARSSWYDRREKDDQFAQDWDDAEREYLDEAEAEAFRRAIDGVDVARPYTHWDGDEKETRFHTINEKSDRLLEFVLKNRHPEYKPTKNLEISGPGGAPLVPASDQTNFDNLTDDELEQLVELQRKLHGRDGEN